MEVLNLFGVDACRGLDEEGGLCKVQRGSSVKAEPSPDGVRVSESGGGESERVAVNDSWDLNHLSRCAMYSSSSLAILTLQLSASSRMGRRRWMNLLSFRCCESISSPSISQRRCLHEECDSHSDKSAETHKLPCVGGQETVNAHKLVS